MLTPYTYLTQNINQNYWEGICFLVNVEIFGRVVLPTRTPSQVLCEDFDYSKSAAYFV